MAVTWSECAPAPSSGATTTGRPALRLVGDVWPTADLPSDTAWGIDRTGLEGTALRAERAPVSAAVRRRRALFALMAGLLAVLALPLSGTGGHSHPTGSVSAGNLVAGVYTVQPGDSLWSIAARLDPSADPRPMVARLADQTGSDTVTPGEHIDLP